MSLVCCLLTPILTFLKFIGFLKLIELIYRLCRTVQRQSRTTEHLSERYGKGSWAVVTGGSDGIGLAMCKELARRDFNIVIVARNPEKMEDAAKEIKSVNQGCQVRKVTFDFTDTVEHAVEWYQKGIIDKISDLDISILVNNAGYMQPGDFERVST